MPHIPAPIDGRATRPLTQGWVKHRLIRQLAEDRHVDQHYADEYGVSSRAISAFRAKWAIEIADAKKDLEDEFSHLWIANKAYRLAEMQEDVERIADTMDPEMLAVKHKALRYASEELGQLPGRQQIAINTGQVSYTIEGVDMETLR